MSTPLWGRKMECVRTAVFGIDLSFFDPNLSFWKSWCIELKTGWSEMRNEQERNFVRFLFPGSRMEKKKADTIGTNRGSLRKGPPHPLKAPQKSEKVYKWKKFQLYFNTCQSPHEPSPTQDQLFALINSLKHSRYKNWPSVDIENLSLFQHDTEVEFDVEFDRNIKLPRWLRLVDRILRHSRWKIRCWHDNSTFVFSSISNSNTKEKMTYFAYQHLF